MSKNDQISIIGIKGFGYHGVFEHEARDGQDFFVDVVMNLDLSKASQTDSLDDTVDYGAITDLVISEILGPRVQLIEKLAARIADSVLRKDRRILSASITVHKPSAPVSAAVKDISVTIIR
jgi:dihydroneopterin aldolase